MQDPKKFLCRARKIEQEIAALEADKERTRQLMFSVSAVNDGMPKSNSVTSKPENIAVKLADYDREIVARINTLIDVKRVIRAAIDQLEDERHRVVLTEYYINCKTCEQIAVDMHYTFRNITRLHGCAMKKMSYYVL